MRPVTCYLLAGLILTMGLVDPATTPAASDQPAALQSGSTEDLPLPLYQAPKKLTPRARVGGGLRGTDGSDPVIVALVPDHVGFTIKKTPGLNWFLSKPTTYPLKFTLINNEMFKPMHEVTIPTPEHAGVQSINLNNFGIVLEPDVTYRWFISAVRDPESPSKDIVAGGMIERCEFNTCLITMDPYLGCDLQSVRWNAGHGFWYDAISCLCDLIKTDPQDTSLRRVRAGLLKQVGLNGVAEWDLKSLPPEK